MQMARHLSDPEMPFSGNQSDLNFDKARFNNSKYLLTILAASGYIDNFKTFFYLRIGTARGIQDRGKNQEAAQGAQADAAGRRPGDRFFPGADFADREQ